LNFLGIDPANGPISISIVKDEKNQVFQSIIRLKTGYHRVSTSVEAVKCSAIRKLLGMGPSAFDILRAIMLASGLVLNISRLREVQDPRLPQALLGVEEKQVVKGFKFGVLYAQEGQTNEDEFFSNVDGSAEFEEFLDFFGEKIKLKDWNHFSGGLDIKKGTTGNKSLYYKWRGNECMFHVSTLLPYTANNMQQLERKRHIGNDLVVIVFLDKNAEWKPSYLTSRQIHVVVVIQQVELRKDPDETYYQVGIIAKDGVPNFGPPIDKNTLFKKSDVLREFLFAKLCNAERASYSSSLLARKFEHARQSLLEDIVSQFK